MQIAVELHLGCTSLIVCCANFSECRKPATLKHSGAAEHQVAIFDATNSTSARRQYLIDRFHGRVQYLFIESVCDDSDTIRKNMELKLKYSPDYAGMSHEEVPIGFWFHAPCAACA